MTAAVLRLSPEDNVVVSLRKLERGETVEVDGGTLTIRDAVPFAHKIATTDLAEGAQLRKFGVPIGSAVRPIAAGEHVHVHNIKSDYIVNATDFFEEQGESGS